MALSSGLALEDITVAAYVAQASYADDPQASFLAVQGDPTATGLSSVDLSSYLPSGTTDSFDSGNVFQGGEMYVADLFASSQELRDAFATALFGTPVTGSTVSQFALAGDDFPAEAVAFVSDGSGDGDTETLYLAIRGTDSIVDAAMGGQAFLADGQAAYFMMLMPFFDAALEYARDEGLERIVVTGGSLGGAMADLFSLFVKPVWETEISVSVVSIASAGLADGVVPVLGAALGLPQSAWPTAQGDGTFARPGDHLNFANTQDLVAHPELVSNYIITDQLQSNQHLADEVQLDQLFLNGLTHDFQNNTFGEEHGGDVYLETILALAGERPDLADAEDLAGTLNFIASAGNNVLSMSSLTGVGLAGDDTVRTSTGNATDDTLIGNEGDDHLVGRGGDDWYLGGSGTDTAEIAAASSSIGIDLNGEILMLTTSDGVDGFHSIERFQFTDQVLTYAEIVDMVDGSGPSDGDDVLVDALGAQAFDGLGGTDTVDYSGATGRVLLDFQTDVSSAGYARFYDVGAAEGDTYVNIENAIGGDFADNLRGDGNINELSGGGVSDRLYGRGGDDILNGGTGADALYGNLGADVMTGGSDAGRSDRYIYFGMAETGVGAGNRDIITDFVSGEDRIELRRLDADTTQGLKQFFDFIGDAGFSGTAGELGYRQEGGNTIVEGDVTGDGIADFEIELSGVMDLVEADFFI